MIQLLLSTSAGTMDITSLVSTVSWSGNYKQCARTLEFSVLTPVRSANIPAQDIPLGAAVSFFYNSVRKFVGYVFARRKSTSGSRMDITAFDRGIYLRRNKASYKFTALTPEGMARKICSDYGIPQGSLAKTNHSVTRNFFGTTLWDIVLTGYTMASEQNGKKYVARFEEDKFCVFEKSKDNVVFSISYGKNLMDASISESVENMVNQVCIYDKDNNLVKTVKKAEDIQKYGLLQDYIKQSGADDKTAEAQAKLKDNGIQQKITVDNLGDIRCVTGNAVSIKEPYTGITGIFFIDNDIHTWKQGQYYNKLELNFDSIMADTKAGSDT